jgi:LMBR1 domain-containing protein 1
VEPESLVNRLKLWIPDTIIFNDGNCPPMWFFTNSDGYVFRSDTFNSRNIINKLSNYTSSLELVALNKR